MKIFTAEQIRQLDAYTIKNEPIDSIDLMERASLTFVDWFTTVYPDEEQPIYIFCGIGNNGGDGLAVARLLHHRFYDCVVYHCKISEQVSPDFQTNLDRLPPFRAVKMHALEKGDEFPVIPEKAVIIDAIFGSGLNRPVTGYWATLLEYLNLQTNARVAIDIPSGLFADQHTEGSVFKADHTFSFELPKLAFLFPENKSYVGKCIHESIGLHPDFIENTDTPFHYINTELAASLLKERGQIRP